MDARSPFTCGRSLRAATPAVGDSREFRIRRGGEQPDGLGESRVSVGKNKAMSHPRRAAVLARVRAGRPCLNCNHRLVWVVFVAVFFAACDTGSPRVAPSTSSPDASPTNAPSVEIASCAGLDVPRNREVNTNLDRESGLLDFSYFDPRFQRDKHLTIRYRDDPSCRRNPQTRFLIQHVGAGLEIAGCLDLPSTPPTGMVRVELWFGDAVDRSAVAPSLVVHRDIPGTDAIAAATLRAWIEGPTEKEKAAGAYPAAPDGTELLGIDVDDGTAVVDVNRAFEDTGLGTTYEGAILEALAGTITQFDTVDRALLKIDGEFNDYYMGHGFIVDDEHPLTRPGKKGYRVAPEC